MDAQQCFDAFGCQPAEQMVVIKEHHLADSNFAFSYLLKQALANEGDRVILVLTHNSLAHYACVAKKLGYNLLDKVQSGVAKTVDVQGIVLSSLSNDSIDALNHIKHLIDCCCKELLQISQKTVYIFFDDFAHMHHLTHNLSESINFMNELLAGYYNNPYVKYIVGVHIGDEKSAILSRDLEYSADCIIDVSLMKMGCSDDVSGVLKVLRNRRLTTFHYKIKEYGVVVTAPGNFLIGC